MRWYCVGTRPRRWVVGDEKDGFITNVKLDVVQNDDGSWRWICFEPYDFGVEPSCDLAMQVAERLRMTEIEKLAYQYCHDSPDLGQIVVQVEKGILFTGPDSPPGGEFIPFSDLGYSKDIGFYRKSVMGR